MSDIKQLLESGGIRTEGVKIKLVRHVMKKHPERLQRYVAAPDAAVSGKNFTEWQRVQGVKSFGKELRKCELFVSCCFLRDGRALFTGVFHNESGDSPDRLDIGRDLSRGLADIYRARPRRERECYFFKFRRDERFAKFERRVIVEWGTGARRWVQNFYGNRPKRILRCLHTPRPIFDEGFGA